MPNTSSSVFGHGRPPVGPGSPINQGLVAPPANKAPEARFLGSIVEYKTTYDPSLLQPVPRQENRNHLNISDDNLPFVGYDVWNAYEVSCLTDNGIPVVGVCKIKYPADSTNIVESKSIKLYLNAFNMTKVGDRGDTSDVVRSKLGQIIQQDLSNVLGIRSGKVEVSMFPPNVDVPTLEIEGMNESVEYIDDTEVGFISQITEYTEAPHLLKLRVDRSRFRVYASSLLRSNCKITHQPDWGTVIIAVDGKSHPDKASLLEYIISFRNENHFHEEICETLFTRLTSLLVGSEVGVCCLYTRRGGIDINPVRGTSKRMCDVFEPLGDMSTPSPKTSRQ